MRTMKNLKDVVREKMIEKVVEKIVESLWLWLLQFGDKMGPVLDLLISLIS